MTRIWVHAIQYESQHSRWRSAQDMKLPLATSFRWQKLAWTHEIWGLPVRKRWKIPVISHSLRDNTLFYSTHSPKPKDIQFTILYDKRKVTNLYILRSLKQWMFGVLGGKMTKGLFIFCIYLSYLIILLIVSALMQIQVTVNSQLSVIHVNKVSGPQHLNDLVTFLF